MNAGGYTHLEEFPGNVAYPILDIKVHNVSYLCNSFLLMSWKLSLNPYFKASSAKNST